MPERTANGCAAAWRHGAIPYLGSAWFLYPCRHCSIVGMSKRMLNEHDDVCAVVPRRYARCISWVEVTHAFCLPHLRLHDGRDTMTNKNGTPLLSLLWQARSRLPQLDDRAPTPMEAFLLSCTPQWHARRDPAWFVARVTVAVNDPNCALTVADVSRAVMESDPDAKRAYEEAVALASFGYVSGGFSMGSFFRL